MTSAGSFSTAPYASSSNTATAVSDTNIRITNTAFGGWVPPQWFQYLDFDNTLPDFRNWTFTLDSANKNRYGDPMPRIEHRMDEPTTARDAATKEHVLRVFNTMARASNGRIVNTGESDYLDHPGGGCRMGTDPAASVCDSHGRTHDHENLFVVGAPTTPTGGCTNGTLTFVALTLRSADEIARHA